MREREKERKREREKERKREREKRREREKERKREREKERKRKRGEGANKWALKKGFGTAKTLCTTKDLGFSCSPFGTSKTQRITKDLGHLMFVLFLSSWEKVHFETNNTKQLFLLYFLRKRKFILLLFLFLFLPLLSQKMGDCAKTTHLHQYLHSPSLSSSSFLLPLSLFPSSPSSPSLPFQTPLLSSPLFLFSPFSFPLQTQEKTKWW